MERAICETSMVCVSRVRKWSPSAKKDLRLVFQAQKGFGINDTVAVALEVGAHIAGIFFPRPAAALGGFLRERGEKHFFHPISAFFDAEIFMHRFPFLLKTKKVPFTLPYYKFDTKKKKPFSARIFLIFFIYTSNPPFTRRISPVI